MAVKRLVLDAFEDDYYELIAIHSSLESYKLAFLLNQNLNLRLCRKSEDLIFRYDDLTANFEFFQYYDQFQYNTYNLISNKYRSKVNGSNNFSEGLFGSGQDNYATRYLIPELKKVDFFLKIETENSKFSPKLFINSLLNIAQIVTAYSVNHSELKSKNNLILD